MQSSKESQEEIKKAFFSEQCKEIEENNRMGKTRDLFKKITDTHPDTSLESSFLLTINTANIKD